MTTFAVTPKINMQHLKFINLCFLTYIFSAYNNYNNNNTNINIAHMKHRQSLGGQDNGNEE